VRAKKENSNQIRQNFIEKVSEASSFTSAQRHEYNSNQLNDRIYTEGF
jgi:hypothetical protein